MTACNKQPPPDHPFHGSGVACHLPAEHEGPCTWEGRPSNARRGIDRLLGVMPLREVESIDTQPGAEIRARTIDEDSRHVEETTLGQTAPGPWVLVRFVGGDLFAIWKATGDVYRVGVDGAVEEDPTLPGPTPPLLTEASKGLALAELEQRRRQQPERVDQASLPAGSDITYYCHGCGWPTAIMPENWWERSVPRLCPSCQALADRGWLDYTLS